MKAVIFERYGSPDVLELREVEKPVVKDDGVLIKVQSASVNRSDWEGLTAHPRYVRISGGGFLKPKHRILGSDIAGTIETIGRDVSQFQPGDEVFGDILWHGSGGFAEYVSVPESAPLALKPANLTFEDAAALPQGAVLGLQGLSHKKQTEPGQMVLINGAGGGAGSFAVQIAKSLGAEVTGVDRAAKFDMMRSIGADHVIDYTRNDPTKGGQRYDRILDFAAYRSILAYKPLLRHQGIYSMVGGSVPRLLQTAVLGSMISLMGRVNMSVLIAKPNKQDLSYLAGLVEAGTITPVIHKRYELSEVPQALRDLGEGKVIGKAVIRL